MIGIRSVFRIPKIHNRSVTVIPAGGVDETIDRNIYKRGKFLVCFDHAVEIEKILSVDKTYSVRTSLPVVSIRHHNPHISEMRIDPIFALRIYPVYDTTMEVQCSFFKEQTVDDAIQKIRAIIQRPDV